jgi:hypothetical protein
MHVLAYGAKLPVAEAYRALCEEIQQRWNSNGAGAQWIGKVPL